jgi:hypothetical protein
MPLQANVFLAGENISPANQEVLSKIEIVRNFGQRDFYGSSLEEVRTFVFDAVSSFGDNNKSVCGVASDIVAANTGWMLRRHGGSHVWLALRSTPVTDVFDLPRWHRDGIYFPSPNKVFKLVQSLVGPQSRFARIVDVEKFDMLEQRQMQGDDTTGLRMEIVSTVEEIFPTQSRLQAVEFLVGDEEAAVHSEPPLTEPRLFYSLVVGNREQISILEDR